MIIHDIADFLVNLTCKDIKPDIYSVFDSPCEHNCPNNVNSEKLTILEILNTIGYRLKSLFGFVKINTTTETIDESEAVVNVSGDVDNLNFDFKIPRGKTGPQGPAGKQGPGVATGGTTGQVLAKKSNANYDTEWIDNSDGGSTVSVNVGETTTGESGTNASVTNSGDETNVVLNFTIPRGKTGPQGPAGKQGPAGGTGPAGPGVTTGGTTGQVLAKKSNANYDTEWIDNSGGGSTVSVNVGETTTGESGTNASVTNSGDETNVVLNFTIPRGNTGPQGPAGKQGPAGGTGPQGPAGKQGPAGGTGPAGPGVATGGTTGQVLAKKSNANYDTEWIVPCPYWIGDILTTMNETNPAQRWPGTAWEQITDCMLRAADDTHPAGSTGGAWDVTQTVEQVAKHTHAYASFQHGYPTTFSEGDLYITPIGRVPYNEREQEGTESSPTGKNKPMPITNKYTACYMWKRTA